MTADVKTPGRCSGPGVEVERERKPAHPSAPAARRQRMPAYGRALRDALRAGLRPNKLGGAVLITSDWTCARAAAPARLVCPPDEGADWSFDWLAGVEVLVLVPERDELHGERLAAALRDAGAALVVLAVHRGEP